MAKKKNKIHRRKKTTIPLAVVGGLSVGLREPVQFLMQGNIEGAAWTIGRFYTGYDYKTGKFNLWDLKRGVVPLVLGVGVHKVASRLGINRAISSTGIPWIRV